MRNNFNEILLHDQVLAIRISINHDLKDINTSLNDMFDQFDIQDADELTFHFDTETELRLKEKYS